jgi:hypothetical protein
MSLIDKVAAPSPPHGFANSDTLPDLLQSAYAVWGFGIDRPLVVFLAKLYQLWILVVRGSNATLTNVANLIRQVLDLGIF